MLNDFASFAALCVLLVVQPSVFLPLVIGILFCLPFSRWR